MVLSIMNIRYGNFVFGHTEVKALFSYFAFSYCLFAKKDVYFLTCILHEFWQEMIMPTIYVPQDHFEMKGNVKNIFVQPFDV